VKVAGLFKIAFICDYEKLARPLAGGLVGLDNVVFIWL